MKNLEIHKCRLYSGLFLADLCLLFPTILVAGLANSAFMGGTPNVSGFWTCVVVAGGMLIVLDGFILSGAFWLRWLFYVMLSLITFATLSYSSEFIHAASRLNADSLVPALSLVVGLILCPLSVMLLAIGVRTGKG